MCIWQKELHDQEKDERKNVITYANTVRLHKSVQGRNHQYYRTLQDLNNF